MVVMTNILVPDLKIKSRTGGYARGQEGLEQILRAALSILIEHGYRAITLRRIATDCGMKVGNISYYFKSKDELIRVLLDAVISSYEEAFAIAMERAGTDPVRRMETLITLILEDITTKKTTRVFPELWALANHDSFVKDRVDELYAREHVFFEDLIAEINPALPLDERKTLAMFISAAMEGMTVFAGYNRLWRPRMGWVENIARHCFIPLVQNLKPGEVSALNAASIALPKAEQKRAKAGASGKPARTKKKSPRGKSR